jgi:hypothetical protein
MAQSGHIKDREFSSFIESPTRGGGNSAREVFVGNDINNPSPVSMPGESFIEFFSLALLAGLASENIGSLTVPPGKTLLLQRVMVSGDNIAKYSIIINDVVKSVKRSWWGSFDRDFYMGQTKVESGSVLRVLVSNQSNSLSDFNATVVGRLLDA